MKQLNGTLSNRNVKYFSKRKIFVFENYVFQRELLSWHIPCSIPTCFDFFFCPFCPLLCHDGNTAVGLGWKLLCSSSVPGEMLPRRWKDLCTTSVVQSISTWVQHSALTVAFVKNLTPEHLRLILSQPEPVASEGDCPALSAGNLLLWAYMFLHVSEARVFLDTL